MSFSSETKELSTISTVISPPAAAAFEKKERDQEQIMEKSLLPVTGLRFIALFSGLLLGFFMAALDTTIVITALGEISSEFDAVDQIGWVGSAYLLTLSGFQPIYCSMADIIGKKYSYIICVVIFILGSVLCGASNSMNMLIISRAIQGVGGAGLLTSALIIICSLMNSRERAIYQGVLGSALGVAFIAGPLLGGLLADNKQWSVIIMIIIALFCNLPLTAKQLERSRGEKTIFTQLKQVDYASLLLLMPGAVCILTGLQIGGEQLTFGSPTVITLLALGPIFFILFVIYEIWIVKHNPIFPRYFIMSVTNMAVLVVQFSAGIIDNAIIYFIPLHFQIVKGDTAVQSALELMSFFITAVGGALISGVIVKKTGHYRGLLWISTALCIIGASLLQSCTIDTSSAIQYTDLAILGLGVGICKNMFVVAGQAAVTRKDLSIATAHGQFMRLFGGAFGVNFAAVLFRYYSNSSLKNLEKVSHQELSLKNLSLLNVLPSLLKRQVQIICLTALNKIYLFVAVASGVTFISTLLIKESKISEKEKEEEED